MKAREIPFLQVGFPVCYRNKRIDVGYRMDMVVGGLVVVEIKAIEKSCRSMRPSCPSI